MMKIYNVIQEDKYIDTEATPFLELSTAIKWAKEVAEKCVEFPNTVMEFPVDNDNYVYYVEYRNSHGRLWITEHEIKQEEI